MLRNLSILTLITLPFIACVNNVEAQEEITESISYSTSIQTVFNQSCGGSACHTNGGKANGISLASYNAAISSMGTSYSGKTIIPGNAGSSPLIEKIRPNPTKGSQMPLTGSKLDAKQVAIIEAWINQGALNN